jgi:6-phosphogluconolactonase
VLCTDLGTDGIHVYAFDAATARLTPVEPLVQVAQGAGVRHGTFDPSGRRFYVINELDATITGFAWEASTGKLEAISSVSTLPQPVEGNLTAELEFHPNGKFLYGSNRGHNSLAIYAVEPATGHLTPLGHTEIGAAEPRHFHIHPSGDWLITADQKASQVSVFQINPSTGALTHTGITCPTHQPVCVLSVV